MGKAADFIKSGKASLALRLARDPSKPLRVLEEIANRLRPLEAADRDRAKHEDSEDKEMRRMVKKRSSMSDVRTVPLETDKGSICQGCSRQPLRVHVAAGRTGRADAADR